MKIATLPAAVETARDRLGPAMVAAVDRLSPDIREVAAYHLGLPGSDRRVAGASGGAGKALRPTLALLSARAAGAAPEQAVPAAVAVELVHNFSLLHDDIMDGDTERRHRPTAWTVYGVGGAILAGDALLALAQDLLLEGPRPQSVWASRSLSAAVQRLIAGQGADLAFERRSYVTLAECLDMADGKTAALMACACSIGAIYVGGPAATSRKLAGFGACAGLAFQLTDDLLGIWGAPEVTGKPVRSDLRARKKSLPVVAALASDTEAGRDLAVLLATPDQLTEQELLRAAELVEAAGGRAWALSAADDALESAVSYLTEADMPQDVRAEFQAIAEFVTARQW
jgi:geranylgeranyl diphosphate synthase, type I